MLELRSYSAARQDTLRRVVIADGVKTKFYIKPLLDYVKKNTVNNNFIQISI